MKNIVQLMFVLLSLSTYVVANKKPVVYVAEPLINLGKIQPNIRIPFKFTIKNSGASPLFILNADPGCQCTYIHDFKSEVVPQDSTSINGIIESAYLSRNFEKVIVLTTNDPQNTKKQLYLTGIVENIAEFYPPLIQYSNMFQDSGVIRKEVKLSHVHGKEFDIKAINHNCNYLSIIKENKKSPYNNLTLLINTSKIPQSEFAFFGTTVEFVLSTVEGFSKVYYNIIIYNDKKSALNR